ncbi:hypothetical protein HAX54_002792 [Datura stramonium]|uniref:Uncharacterized protein n=1 Tax=Datura stramonium TaxID=4076 RepID=A0ABS8WVG7_DATST|nr:hypothetical protein [Datura stramonium]
MRIGVGALAFDSGLESLVFLAKRCLNRCLEADCLVPYYTGGLPLVLLFRQTASCPIVQANNLLFYHSGEIPRVMSYRRTASCPIIQADLLKPYYIGGLSGVLLSRRNCLADRLVLYGRIASYSVTCLSSYIGRRPWVSLYRQANTLILLPCSPFGSSVSVSISLLEVHLIVL